MATVPTQSESQICKPKRRSKKQQQNRVRMITGYIIYASEIRKEIIKKNPDKDFGGISKIVGAEWKGLPQETKVTYEKRAQEQNSLSRMLFANEPLNKLADVAAARAADVEAAARDAEGSVTTRDDEIGVARVSPTEDELRANNNGSMVVAANITQQHATPTNGQMENSLNGSPGTTPASIYSPSPQNPQSFCAASISQMTLHPAQQHQAPHHCCYICCYGSGGAGWLQRYE